jgi:arabinose-5-phosphate isomerase
MKKSKILKDALEVIRIEKKAITDLERRLNSDFTEAVEMIYKCKGRVIVTGIGKSGIIAQKIVATLNSTGTPSVFLHSSDSIHGDLGIIKEGDVVICISKSGDNEDLIQMLQVVRNFNVKVISIVGNLSSLLNNYSDIIIDASVKIEACPYNLAPTSSTTVSLIIGDAIAIALLKKKEFSKEEFAQLHPGGVLGKRLNLKVGDLMATGDNIPIVKENTPFKDVIMEISSRRLGCACVIDKNKKLKGIITDGDIRRLLHSDDDFNSMSAKDFMIKNPKTVTEDFLAHTALELMEKYSITQLIIVSKLKKPVGVIHLHDLVKAGLGG